MNEKTTEDLAFFRDKIDKVDQQLLTLIRQRMDLVAKVGEVKHSAGLPIYAPEREASMLAKRRYEAEQKGVSPQLIEDILHRLMRESYLNEKQMGFKKIKVDLGSVVIIGGAGAMGQLFAQMFELSGYQVVIFDKDNWDNADAQLKHAGLVLVTVPINLTCKLIREKLSNLPADCILADLTSIKTEPLAVMLEAHSGPVVGLHPMFGPDVGTLAKQLMLVCHGRRQQDYQWFLQQIGLWGAEIIELQAKEHDQMMQWIQAMRYFPAFVYGLNLYRHQVDINALLQFSSPVYRLDLAMVSRLFAQSAELYADIIFSQSDNKQLIGCYLEQYKQAFELLQAGDKETFIQWFQEVSHWFADLDVKSDKLLS